MEAFPLIGLCRPHNANVKQPRSTPERRTSPCGILGFSVPSADTDSGFSGIHARPVCLVRVWSISGTTSPLGQQREPPFPHDIRPPFLHPVALLESVASGFLGIQLASTTRLMSKSSRYITISDCDDVPLVLTRSFKQRAKVRSGSNTELHSETIHVRTHVGGISTRLAPSKDLNPPKSMGLVV